MVITYRDANKKIGPIKIFTKHSELNDIINKVSKSDFCPLSNSVFLQRAINLLTCCIGIILNY